MKNMEDEFDDEVDEEEDEDICNMDVDAIRESIEIIESEISNLKSLLGI